MPESKVYDYIVVGAGHNGLVAAYYLAKKGKSVLVVEEKPVVGGAAITEEIHKGFHYSTCADHCPNFPKVIADNFKLKDSFLPYDPVATLLLPEGKSLKLWTDVAKSATEIEKFSKKDAEMYPKYVAFMSELSKLLENLFFECPPDVASSEVKNMLELGKYGLKLRRLGKDKMMEILRILPMSMRDFLDEWFESEALKSLIAVQSLWGDGLGPYSTGTAALLFWNSISYSKQFLPPAYSKGGMGKLTSSFADVAKNVGVEIRTGAKVKQIVVKKNQVTGIVLDNGEEIQANAIASNASAQRTFLELIDTVNIPPKLRHNISNIKAKGVTFKMNLALDKLPAFSDHEIAKGPVYIAPNVMYIEKASDAIKYKKFSSSPIVMLTIPSLHDASLAPENKHVASIMAQYAPYDLQEDWNTEKEKFADIVSDTLHQYIADFKDCVAHRHILSPHDLEKQFSFPQGHIHHAMRSLDQLFLMRPVLDLARYQTPIKNLYLCGAGVHPGAGITGLPGYNAAHKMLKDNK